MKLLRMCLVFAWLTAAGAALADPPAQVGRISHVSGAVSFAPADAANDWVQAPLNRPVTTGDRLWTERDGRAELRIGAAAIRINALTSVDVLRLDELGTQLRLAQGTLNVRLRQRDADDSFEISTPGGAVLLTRPGSYRITVDGAGVTTTVLVREGEADVLTGATPLALRDNQFLAFSAQGQEALAPPAPDAFDEWAAARDRQDEQAVATRYVPQTMTGHEDLDQYGAWHTTPEYGAVWTPSAVAAGWAPYSDGHWAWISPWGWTWVDSAPWGFAPFHYGRWVWLGRRWAWAPGSRAARPVYAPALVAFVGGANGSFSAGASPAVGWVPLGWREPYIPWYRHSPTYVRNVNITHVTNVNIIQRYSDRNEAARIRYVNRVVPSATTVIARDAFLSARHVRAARLHVPEQSLSAARVVHDAPAIRPERHSFAPTRPGARLPDRVAAREVVTTRAPAAAARFGGDDTGGSRRAAAQERPRVRVLGEQPAMQRQRTFDAPMRRPAPDAPAPAMVTPPPAPAPAVVQSPRPPAERREAAPRANTVAPPVPPQADTQRRLQEQRARQAHDERERERQARAQARQQLQQQQLQQQQQQRLQEQREQHRQAAQERAHAVQQQRDRQQQQAQQAEQQRMLQRQQREQQRQAARAERQNASPAQTPPPPSRNRRAAEGERAPHQR